MRDMSVPHLLIMSSATYSKNVLVVLMMLLFHFFNIICIYKPQISPYIIVAHSFGERNVTPYLFGVFRTVGSEFEVDYHYFVAVFHHTVGAMLFHRVGGCIVVENGTLVEQVRRYIALTKAMGYNDVRGYLWFVYTNNIEEVK